MGPGLRKGIREIKRLLTWGATLRRDMKGKFYIGDKLIRECKIENPPKPKITLLIEEEQKDFYFFGGGEPWEFAMYIDEDRTINNNPLG